MTDCNCKCENPLEILDNEINPTLFAYQNTKVIAKTPLRINGGDETTLANDLNFSITGDFLTAEIANNLYASKSSTPSPLSLSGEYSLSSDNTINLPNGLKIVYEATTKEFSIGLKTGSEDAPYAFFYYGKPNFRVILPLTLVQNTTTIFPLRSGGFFNLSVDDDNFYVTGLI